MTHTEDRSATPADARSPSRGPVAGRHHDEAPALLRLALGDGTPRKALLTALVVGALLTAINHGDAIVSAGAWPSPAKLLLTFVVPYCVATWGAITAKQTQWRQTHGAAGRTWRDRVPGSDRAS